MFFETYKCLFQYLRIGLVRQRPGCKGFRRGIRVTRYAARDPDSGFSHSLLAVQADMSADQGIHPGFPEYGRFLVMIIGMQILYSAFRDCPILCFIVFKCFCFLCLCFEL